MKHFGKAFILLLVYVFASVASIVHADGSQTRTDDLYHAYVSTKATETANLDRAINGNKRRFPAEDVIEDTLRVLGQIVAKRATKAGYAMLKEQMNESLRCDDAGSPFSGGKTCNMVGTLRVQDLLAKPELLLSSAIEDVLAYIQKDVNVLDVRGLFQDVDGDLLADAILSWSEPNIASESFEYHLLNQMRLLPAGACPRPSDPVWKKALWSVAECAVKKSKETDHGSPESGRKAALSYDSGFCILEQLTACQLSQEERVMARKLALLAKTVFEPAEDVKDRKKRNEDLVYFLFAVVRERANASSQCQENDQKKREVIINKACIEVVDGMQSITLGRLNDDPIRMSSGAAGIIKGIYALKKKDSKGPASNGYAGTKLFRAVPAMLQYAETYGRLSEDGEALFKERVSIMEGIVDSFTSRSERAGGWVVSLGGSLGVSGGRYGDSIGYYRPALPLGLGIQYYPASLQKKNGFHAQLSLADLGQYVVWSGDEQKVENPDLKDALSPSIAIGWWFTSRELPMFIAFHGGSTPPLREKIGAEHAWFYGIMAGIYVPLLDFN